MGFHFLPGQKTGGSSLGPSEHLSFDAAVSDAVLMVRVVPLRAPLKYTQMAQKYGPVFSYRQGDRLICVINGYKASSWK